MPASYVLWDLFSHSDQKLYCYSLKDFFSWKHGLFWFSISHSFLFHSHRSHKYTSCHNEPCSFKKKSKWTVLFTSSDLPFRRRQWHPTPVVLPGKPHGWRSLVGCSPWDREESDTTEWLHFHFSLSYVGEGNGNPLQCSCLENPRDGEAWWAAIYGVAHSRTRLKQLSSSSSSLSSHGLWPNIYQDSCVLGKESYPISQESLNHALK